MNSIRSAAPVVGAARFRRQPPLGAGVLVLAVAACSACGAVTPAPRFSHVSPADENAPEAASPLPAPVLSQQPEVEAARGTKADTPVDHAGHAAPKSDPHAGHEGHGQPATAAPTREAAYTCPHHPEVEAKAPGSCPKCGSRLVVKPETEPRP